MGSSEIPSKIIERTESLTERKLAVALDLTKIICDKKTPMPQEEVLDIFFSCYEKIRELNPPPLEKISQNRFLYVWGLFFILALSVIAYFYLSTRIFQS